jgi:hypothetical protein
VPYIRQLATSPASNRPVGAGEFDAVVEGSPDGGMPPGAEIGVAPGDEKLPATGGEPGAIVGPRKRQRQVSEEHEVDERKEKPIEERTGFLAGKPARQIDTT